MSLKTDYKDYELAPSMGGQRHYRVTENADGTQSLTDVSEYLEIGDSFKAEDINATNSAVNDLANTPNDVTDLKMLGWTVPKEMPIKNYTDNNGVYLQRVGRKKVSDCNITLYNIAEGKLFRTAISDIKMSTASTYIPKVYLNGYTTTSMSTRKDKTISQATSNQAVDILDNSYADVTAFKNAMLQQNAYVYYELATEITKSVDGNEVTSEIKGIDTTKVVKQESNTPYTATEDCFMVGRMASSKSGYLGEIFIDNAVVLTTNSTATCPFCLPIKKGQAISFGANTTVNMRCYGIK